MNQDQEHLKLLSILHYVFGGLTALCSCFPLLYVGMGFFFLSGGGDMGAGAMPPVEVEGMENLPAEEFPDDAPDDTFVEEDGLGDLPADSPFAGSTMNEADAQRLVGGMFVVGGAIFFLFFMISAALVIAAGRNLGAHRGYIFCLVIAALECLSVPLGTVLGVFTIVVLQRESVKELFGQGANLEEADTY